MSRKVLIEDGTHHEFLRKQDLHAEFPKDIKVDLRAIKHPSEKMPRNPNTHISIRLPQTLCDWVWAMYPNEPTISSAVQRYMKEQYGAFTKADSV